MRIETHVHTRYSSDSMLPLWAIILSCRVHKISVIAITDHNTIKGGVRIKEIYSKKLEKHGITVIVGEEIMTESGEIIGLFLNKPIEKGLTLDETISRIKDQGGIVYVPHPFDSKRIKTVLPYNMIETNKSNIDCIECYNGRNISYEYGIKQEEIANSLALPKIIGSDAHTMLELGRNYMISSCDIDVNNRDDFISLISNVTYNKSRCLKSMHIITKFVKGIRMIKGGNFHDFYRVIHKKASRRMRRMGH